MKLDPRIVEFLRCPVTKESVHLQDGWLVTESNVRKYRVSDSGIPLFAEHFCSTDGKKQQFHYDKISKAYVENLTYPHTQEYTKYLDSAFLEHVEDISISNVAEICCGRGEAFRLLKDRIMHGVGVDVSQSMLEVAARDLSGQFVFLQGDATMLPLKDEIFDCVFMFGGIHHVNDRERLFSEVFRVLKKGGKFYWREPVSDFFLWRWLRTVIYKLSPTLDNDTERPLLYRETVPPLEKVGFKLKIWETYGFLGFCFFMNSDVLIFNRIFRFIPGIRWITRLAASLDDWTVHLPGLKRAGLQVVGVAEKPYTKVV